MRKLTPREKAPLLGLPETLDQLCGFESESADGESIAGIGSVNDGEVGFCTVSWGDVKCDAEIICTEGNSVSGTYDEAVGRSCCSLN